MTLPELANTLAHIASIPMDDDTAARVRGAVLLAAAGFPAEAA